MEKFFKYLWYLLRHKWYVLIECFKHRLFIEGIIHDISKFLPDEFFPYMNYFYGAVKTPEEKDKTKKKFNVAWLKHQHRNKHHWQYWILKNDQKGWEAIEIPERNLQELVCDWVGAGKAIHGKNDVIKWYEENSRNFIIESDSLEYLKSILSKEPIYAETEEE
jgi:hypothetical protein